MPVCQLTDRRLVRIDGAEARTFLQGLVSNDVEKAAESAAVWCALLTAQGKYLYDFFVLGGPDNLTLDTRADDVASLIKKLTMYKLRAKIDIVDTGDAFSIYAGFGADASFEIPAGVTGFKDPRLADAGRRYIVPADLRQSFESAAGTRLTDADAYDRHRIKLGLPAAPDDLISEKTTLLEAGFDELGGVDWKKGCYMGQELTARTKYRGLVKKRLVPVSIDGPAPEPDSPVMEGERAVGEMRSSAGAVGMALLRIDAIRSGRRLHSGGASLQPITPAWLRLPEAETPD